MTATPIAPFRKKPVSFKIALIAAISAPVTGGLFLLLMITIGNDAGPEGLGPIIIGFTVFVLSIPLAALLLGAIAITSAISNSAYKRRVAAGKPVEEDEEATAAHVVYALLALLGAAPLIAAIVVLGSIASYSATAHSSALNQDEAKVKAAMQQSLDDVGYKTLPGASDASEAIEMSSDKDRYGPTTYSASVSLAYADAKAIPEAQKRLIAKGWSCKVGAVAPVAQASALAATGSKTPNISCGKEGREVLNFTYISPTRALLSAGTDGQIESLSTPTDFKWCQSYRESEGQDADVVTACKRILGEDQAYEMSKFGLMQKCYDEVNAAKSFSAKKGTLTKECFEEYQQALKRFQEARDNGTLSPGVDQPQR